jgi:protocatechuate 3,4-dioxygenase alpha subunit
MKDIRCRKFSDILASKKSHYPYSDKYKREVKGAGLCKSNYPSEREHMVAWFNANETHGAGAYSRQTPNTSARRCYNSLMNAASLLWIAEAVGIPELTVKQAYLAATKAGDYRRACGAIRKIITWDMIYALA